MRMTSLAVFIILFSGVLQSANGTGPYTVRQSAHIANNKATPSASLVIPLTISDAGTGSVSMHFGVDANATYRMDTALGEWEGPPPPPSGVFYAAWADPRYELGVTSVNVFGQGLYAMDFRHYTDSAQVDTYDVHFQPGAGYPVTFSWPDLHASYSGTVLLQDAVTGGSIINVDMKAQTSYVLSRSTIKAMLIVATGPIPVVGDLPVVSTYPATDLTTNTATLHGTVIANGDSAAVWFEWGTTVTYGNSTPTMFVSGSILEPVSYGITGLAPGTTYHYRLDATNTSGTAYGDNHVFTTMGKGSPPSVNTNSAANITAVSATLSGTVTANADSASVQFEWGTTGSYGNLTPLTVTRGWGSVTVTYDITGLSPGTPYHYHIDATNGSGTTQGDDQTFTTLSPTSGQVIVSLTMKDSSNAFSTEQFGVHPHATYCIDRNLGEAEVPPPPPVGAFECRFVDVREGAGACMGQGLYMDVRQFVSSTQIDTYQLRFQSGSAGLPLTFSWPNLDSLYSGPVQLVDPFGGTLVNIDMKAQTSYDFTNTRLNNLYVIAQGPVAQPLVPIIASTVYGFNGRMADLGAGIYSNGYLTNTWLEYGTTASYGQTTAAQFVGDSDHVVQFFQEVSGLQPETRYHFRAVASNANGMVYGSDNVFQTPSFISVPYATTNPATNVTATSATLNAVVGLDSGTVASYFEWGPTTTYGHTTPETFTSGPGPVFVTYNLNGLSPNSTYHYRIYAYNSAGGVRGGDQFFTTSSVTQRAGFSIPLFVRNGTESGVISFGVNVNATRCIDTTLGEYELPPPPPTGDFDVRFIYPIRVDSLKCFGQGVSLDLRGYDSSSQRDVYVFTVQPGQAGYPITISWPDLNPYYSGKVLMWPESEVQTNPVFINMKLTDSVVLQGGMLYVAITAEGPILQPYKPPQLRLSPGIVSARDVPFDQGGFVTVKWNASVLDTNVNLLPYYSIWRAIPDNGLTKSMACRSSAGEKPLRRLAKVNGVEIAWEWVAAVPAHRFWEYSYTVQTLYDSSDETNGKHYFLVSAQTSDPNVFYDSNVDSGYSVDNLPPDAPRNVVAIPRGGTITLRWSANHEPDLRGYVIYRSTSPIVTPDRTTMLAPTGDTTYVDAGPMPSHVVYYLVRAQDIHGNLSNAGGEVNASPAVGVLEMGSGIPSEYALRQNYPNPFNPSTTIAFDLVREDFVTLKIYNTLGQEIATPVSNTLAAGRYQMKFDASRLLSGVYFYRITAVSSQSGAREFDQTRKFMLLR